ncbi:hypothetical protein BpHYR1_030598 [Brachionus plicatilis]|uniref:Uncharacterized protein n=1 Tax=Brachionus plicatilis TaxID=10195 RepID=A0A3M7RG66_BRAPC|nr:hypothetical protein BpHYR1_030598 [Brachionus plicatilis]
MMIMMIISLKKSGKLEYFLRFFSNFCAKIGVINRSNLRRSNLFLDVLRMIILCLSFPWFAFIFFNKKEIDKFELAGKTD